MTPAKFKLVVNAQIKMCKDILDDREQYYGTDDDRLDNFKRVANGTRTTAGHALMNMVGKQWDALNGAVARFAFDDETPDIDLEQFDEWITDIINYMLLLKGLVTEDIE